MQYLKEEVKDRIRLAALNEFKEKGFLDSSIRNIAKNAGVCSGNIYRYFKNKEELLDDIVGPVYIQFMEYVHNMVAANYIDTYVDYSPLKKIDEIKNMIIELIKEYSVELLILMDKCKGSKYEHFNDELIVLADNILKKTLLEDLDESRSSLEDENTTYMLAATIVEGICIILKKHEDGLRIKYLIDQLLNILSAGMIQRFK